VLEGLGRHFTCYVPDLPGAGESQAPVDAEYTPRALGHVIVALQEALHVEKCACVANSMGGYLAMVAALEHGAIFRRLVQVHAPAMPLFRYSALKFGMSLPGSRSL